MKKISALLLPLLVGCHPNSGSVVNKPPVIEDKAETFGITQGNLKPDFFSAVLWPASWTEADYEKNVKTVNLDSQKLLDLLVETQKQPGIQINTLWRQFRLELRCIENFHDDSSPADPTVYNEDSTVSFVVLAPVDPAPEVPPADPNYGKYQDYLAYQAKAKALAACQANLDSRAQLQAQSDAALTAESDPKGPLRTIHNEIDAILGDDSSLDIDVTKTFLKFETVQGVIQANIRIKFTASKKIVSSDNEDPALKISDVKVSSGVDHLTFTVPDLTQPGVAYIFDLVRVKPLYSFDEFENDGTSLPTEEAVFKGDMTMMVGGVAKRAGSAQIVGTFAPVPPDTDQ